MKSRIMKTALFWHKTESGKIQCELCPHHCLLAEKQSGRCRMRRVIDGELKAGGYGELSSAHLDPVEKKPLYHFHPGKEIFSVGGWGCNFACNFCQNWTISQKDGGTSHVMGPDELVQAAGDQRSIGIAYTYNEPLINIEFVYDCAEKARKRGLVNILVTNGFIEEKPAAFLLPFIDALNIDIKSMDDMFYKKQCHGALEPVLRFSKQAVAAGCHVEVTCLLIPGLNDSKEQVGQLSHWIRDNLGEKTPLHLSAYYPSFQMSLPPTSVEVLERAYEQCKRDLNYVYLGNTHSRYGQNTSCPQCGAELISRQGYSTKLTGIVDHACAKCGREADIQG